MSDGSFISAHGALGRNPGGEYRQTETCDGVLPIGNWVFRRAVGVMPGAERPCPEAEAG